jgi:hypothetical protein
MTFEPGQIIFDEYERSDAMFVIRSGLVRVVKKASALLCPDYIRSWKDLVAAPGKGANPPPHDTGWFGIVNGRPHGDSPWPE